MASIIPKEKDGKIVSYKFKSCVGRDDCSKQVFRCMTWKVPAGLVPSKAVKAAQKAAAKWEQKAKDEYQKDLQDAERAIQREIAKCKTDFVYFVKKVWFPICIEDGEHKPKTVSFYNDTTKNITAYFEGSNLQKITPVEIQKFLIFLRTEKGFSPRNVHHHYRTLNMIFAYAVRQDVLLKNPMDKIDPPKLVRNEIDALSQEQAADFFREIHDCPLDFRCLLTLLITTGLRRGECVGLKWRDIDENSLLLRVQRNVIYTAKTGIVVNTPKTAKSRRPVPIMESTLRLLLSLKQKRQRECPGMDIEDSFIFHGEKGIYEPKDPNAVTRRVKRFMASHGLPDLSPHDLRHSCASLLLSSGADIKSVQEILGHTNANTTLNFYVRSDIQQMKAATDKFANAFGL